MKSTHLSLGTVGSTFSQFGHLMLTILQLKLWRFLFLVLPISMVLSNLYIFPSLGNSADRESSKLTGPGAIAYTKKDFANSKHTVLVNANSFPNETAVAKTLVGANRNWIVKCSPDQECQDKFIAEHDPDTIAFIRYVNAGGKRATLDCLWEKGNDLPCAFLYQLMVQSILGRDTNGVFKEVQLFEKLIHSTSNSGDDLTSTDKIKLGKVNLKKRVPDSVCAKWIKTMKIFKILPTGLVAVACFVTIGVSFYMLLSTISCIQMLRDSGFLQQLVRNGLSVMSFWLAIWLITVIECVAFSGIFVLSLTVQCPGVYGSESIVNVFLLLTFHCLFVSAVVLLLNILLSSMFAVATLMLAFTMLLAIAYLNLTFIKEEAGFLLKLLPVTHTSHYIEMQLWFSIESIIGFKIPSNNEWKRDTPEELRTTLTANIIVFFMLVAIIIILDFVLKTGNGLCLPIYFPLSPRFWCPASILASTNGTGDAKTIAEPHIEEVIGLSEVVVVDAVSKSYCASWGPCATDGPKVLQDLSCKIYRSQITALIGHNGAGKSTLIKLLTGEELPSSGCARIAGCPATDPLTRLPLSGRIGICPQFDALCESLTVMQCIQLTLISKAINSVSELTRARGMLLRLGLGDKENVKSHELSGGQKRKLSTIMSLLGDPEVVLLDEPTSGLDPVSRRQLWQLLQEEKINRCILLCTQFMDEADMLADRKIFLCDGKIVCAGSSMFLKRAFGCKFTLNVSLKSKADASALLGRLKHLMLRSHDGTELQLEVPAAKPTVLTEAVQVLEASREVVAFGLSQASLDDVFMRLSGATSDDVIAAFRLGDPSAFSGKASGPGEGASAGFESASGLGKAGSLLQPSILKQFWALFSINLKRQTRVRSRLLARFLVPLTLISALCLLNVTIDALVIKQPNITDTKREMGQETVFGANRYRKLEDSPVSCLYDFINTDPFMVKSECSKLTMSDSLKWNQVLDKQAALSIESYLSTSRVNRDLYETFNSNSTLSADELVVYYSSSWSTRKSNKNKSIAIAFIYNEKSEVKHSIHYYRRAITLIFQLFTAMDVQNTTALSFIRPIRTARFTFPSAIIFCMVFTLFPISYMSDPVEDITSRVRAYLISTGMSCMAYWINTFIMHWLQYIACTAIAVAVQMIFEFFRTSFFIIQIMLPVFTLGIISNQLAVYAIVLLTKSSNPIISLICNLMAVVIPIAFILLEPATVLIVQCVFPPVTPIALVYYGIGYQAHMMEYYHTINDQLNIPNLTKHMWLNPNIRYALIAMPVHIVLLVFAVFMLEWRDLITAVGFDRTKVVSGKDNLEENSADSSVHAEASRMLAAPRNTKNVLEVRSLRKVYANGVEAVRGITFGVEAGEVFGLLGANGAGKSSTMSIIVGEEAPTDGQCEVCVSNGNNAGDFRWVSGSQGASQGAIGYCPQHNPLFDFITVTEHIKFYADMRGLTRDTTDRHLSALIQGLGLSQHQDKQVNQLSGGNRRRLCLAIALLGNPSLIAIDEASTGVDPENKRFIWSAIRQIMRPWRSIMVTTHSMEEVEALCTRVGIMSRGRMISVGTVQQLRSQYGDAYTLDVLMQPESSTATLQQRKQTVQKVLATQFHGAQLLEDLGLGMQFSLPKASVPSLSAALKTLTANQSTLGISYFSMYQMSLDQVFVKVSKMYDNGQHVAKKTTNDAVKVIKDESKIAIKKK